MRTMTQIKCGEWLGLALILGTTLPAAWAQQPTSPSYPVYKVTNSPAPTAASSAPDATPAPPPSAPAQRSAAELEKLAEPIALHPDPLVSIILPAAAYPVEIVQAARFVRDTNNVPKVDDQPWDDNVKSVAKFPQLIAMMDSNLTWTVDLGQAFVDQPKELMDAIQALRVKAQKAGTLQTTSQQIVIVTNIVVVQTNVTQVVSAPSQIVEIVPANPQVVYVPTYPPTVYYPPPAYVYNPYAPLVTFGVGVAVGAIIANNCDWHHGGVYVGPHGAAVWGGGGYHGNVNVNNYNNINVNNSRNANVNNSRNVSGGGGQKWQPDQNRMRTSGAGASASTREARGWGSGQAGGANAGARPSTGNVGARPSTGMPSTGNTGARPSTGNVGARPSTGNVGARPSTGTAGGSRPAASPTASRSAAPTSTFQSKASPSASRSSSSGSAFSGTSSGSSAKNYSSRGSSSRSSSSGGFSGGSRGGGGGGGRGGGGGGRR
jgi:hypothetical protein